VEPSDKTAQRQALQELRARARSLAMRQRAPDAAVNGPAEVAVFYKRSMGDIRAWLDGKRKAAGDISAACSYIEGLWAAERQTGS
jgi:hypothetical protein